MSDQYYYGEWKARVFVPFYDSKIDPTKAYKHCCPLFVDECLETIFVQAASGDLDMFVWGEFCYGHKGLSVRHLLKYPSLPWKFYDSTRNIRG